MLLFLSLTFAIGGMAWVLFPSWRTLVGVAAIVAGIFFIVPEILGRGRPMPTTVTRGIVAHVLEHEVRIHIWAQTKAGIRYYIVPWSTRLAKSLQAAGKAKKKGKIRGYDIVHKEGKFRVLQRELTPSPEKEVP